jgi:hypothetical protein
MLILLGLSLPGIFQSCETHNNVDPPDNHYFIKYYGGDGDQIAVDLLVNDDGTIMFLGNSVSDIASENHMYLLKLEANGNVAWETRLGTALDVAKDLEVTNDGRYIVLADHKKSESNIDMKLLRITADGSPVDSIVYGSPGNESSRTITPLSDGGFIITGSTEYDTTIILDPTRPDDQSDIFHFRCNSNLIFDTNLWQGQYGPGTKDLGTKVFQHAEDQFYVFGSTNLVHGTNTNGKLNLIYYPIDGFGRNGNPNYLGNFALDTESAFIMKIPDAMGAGFLIVSTESQGNSVVNMHISKLQPILQFNTTNDAQFDKTINITSRKLTSLSSTAVVQGERGFVILANEARETGRNMWISKLDQNGNQLWSASYGSEEEDDFGASVIELSDGKLLVAGTVRLINNQYKMVLMKLNSKGLLTD